MAMRRLFWVTWLCSVALWVRCWQEFADAPGLQAAWGEFLVLGAVLVLVPMACGPGLMRVLRRMSAGGINLPYAEYWFSGERRASSLERLTPYQEGFGAMLSAFLSVILVIFVGERVDSMMASYSAMLFLLSTGAFLAGTGLWTRALLRAFPAPDPSTRGAASRMRPRGRTRPRR